MTLKWPVPVYPLPDELLSSWLVRAAFALGCEPMSLTSALWPSWIAWKMDIDRSLADERMKILFESSGLPIDEITRMTLLHHLDGRFFLHGKGLVVLPWIITLGQKNLHHIMGVQLSSVLSVSVVQLRIIVGNGAQPCLPGAQPINAYWLPVVRFAIPPFSTTGFL